MFAELVSIGGELLGGGSDDGGLRAAAITGSGMCPGSYQVRSVEEKIAELGRDHALVLAAEDALFAWRDMGTRNLTDRQLATALVWMAHGGYTCELSEDRKQVVEDAVDRLMTGSPQREAWGDVPTSPTVEDSSWWDRLGAAADLVLEGASSEPAPTSGGTVATAGPRPGAVPPMLLVLALVVVGGGAWYLASRA